MIIIYRRHIQYIKMVTSPLVAIFVNREVGKKIYTICDRPNAIQNGCLVGFN